MSNLNKEEILKVSGVSEDGLKRINAALPIYIYDAMDAFAKQEIMNYEIWLEGELNNDSSFNYDKTPEQLYNEYLKQSNK